MVHIAKYTLFVIGEASFYNLKRFELYRWTWKQTYRGFLKFIVLIKKLSHLAFAMIIFTFLLKVSEKISIGDTFLAPKI